jgi:1-acyl-sn-glycerol-3-phosphate acyltransferase
MTSSSASKKFEDQRNWQFRLVAGLMAPVLRLFFNIKTSGMENLPKGGYILVGNHVSYLYPCAFAYSVYIHMKRVPHYLAKESLFRIPVVGKILPKVGQIPVYRGGKSNEEPLRVAKEYLAAGQVVIVFPEGTLTRDPDLWPMRGKSGAIRLALELGLPVVPAAHWGVEKVLGNYSKKFRPNPFHTVRVTIGKPIYFEKPKNDVLTAKELGEATDKIMREVANLVGQMRGETPPEKLWDPTDKGQTQTGNFRKENK